MPNPSQIRLQQLSGSLHGIGNGISAATGGTALAADTSADVQVLLQKFARALAAIHGNTEMFNATRGVIEHASDAVRVKGSDQGSAQTTSVIQADSGNANSLSLELVSDGADVANSFVKLQNVSGTGASAMTIKALAGGVDIDADGGKLALDGSTGIDIGTEADVAIDVDASTFDLDASGALTIDSAVSISIGTNADKPIDIDSTTFDVDASGAMTLTGTSTGLFQAGDTLGVAMAANDGADKPFTINASNTGGGDGLLDIDADGKLRLDGAGGIDIGVAADVAIDMDASTLDIDASGAVTLDGASVVQNSTTAFKAQGQMALQLSGGNGAAGPLGLSGSVVFSSDGSMNSGFTSDKANPGDMLFAKYSNTENEFADFRGKSIFAADTTVIGALNSLADSVTASEATLLTASVGDAGVSAGNALAITSISGVANDLRTAAPHQLDLFVNGQLLVSGNVADLSGGHIDYSIDGAQVRGAKFAFALVSGDSVVVVDKQ